MLEKALLYAGPGVTIAVYIVVRDGQIVVEDSYHQGEAHQEYAAQWLQSCAARLKETADMPKETARGAGFFL